MACWNGIPERRCAGMPLQSSGFCWWRGLINSHFSLPKQRRSLKCLKPHAFNFFCRTFHRNPRRKRCFHRSGFGSQLDMRHSFTRTTRTHFLESRWKGKRSPMQQQQSAVNRSFWKKGSFIACLYECFDLT